jgi:hypothetical protein
MSEKHQLLGKQEPEAPLLIDQAKIYKYSKDLVKAAKKTQETYHSPRPPLSSITTIIFLAFYQQVGKILQPIQV